MDRLREELAARVAEIQHRGDRPRLWIDRSFSVRGAGTVVTGTLTEGPMKVGDHLELLPGHKRGRIRGMQSHESEIETAEPGRRLALNLTGIDREEASRGTMLGRPGQWEPSARFTALLTAARYVDDLSTRGAFHIHLGSGAHSATIKRLEDGYALIEIPAALPMRTGDRFILRESGRRQVVAGGTVIDPAPGSTFPGDEDGTAHRPICREGRCRHRAPGCARNGRRRASRRAQRWRPPTGIGPGRRHCSDPGAIR